jgi:hypothetical protein
VNQGGRVPVDSRATAMSFASNVLRSQRRSPPPSWSTPGAHDDGAYVQARMHQPSPSLAFARSPRLPAVPTTLQTAAENGGRAGEGDDEHAGPRPAASVGVEHVHLADWQKKMHQRFRMEMVGQGLPDELPPFSPMRSPDASGPRRDPGGRQPLAQYDKPYENGNYPASIDVSEVRVHGAE